MKSGSGRVWGSIRIQFWLPILLRECRYLHEPKLIVLSSVVAQLIAAFLGDYSSLPGDLISHRWLQ